MDYEEKYLKYKLKYLKTKYLKEKQTGGSSIVDTTNSILLALITVSSLYDIYKKSKNNFKANLKNVVQVSKKKIKKKEKYDIDFKKKNLIGL